MPSLSEDSLDVIYMRMLTIWKRSKRPTVSIDALVYKNHFSFIPHKDLVIDSTNSDRVLFVLLDREKAIQSVEQRRDLHYGPQVCRNSV